MLLKLIFLNKKTLKICNWDNGPKNKYLPGQKTSKTIYRVVKHKRLGTTDLVRLIVKFMISYRVCHGFRLTKRDDFF